MDYHWNLESLESFSVKEFFTQLFLTIVTFFVMFGGVVPYLFQYREIYRSQNPRGFSLYVCMTLLAANILRITFWFGKRFELQLLIQSFVMISCMLMLVELSVRVTRNYALPPGMQHSLWDGKFRGHFWQWSDFSSYILCTVSFVLIVSCVSFLCFESALYVEMIGFAALTAEALLGTPQFFTNYYRRSTVGMSLKMVLMWLTGDISKTVYFLIRHTPVQFWFCGIMQISVDLAILSQVAYYNHRSGPGSTVLRTLANQLRSSVPASRPVSASGVGGGGHRYKNSGAELDLSKIISKGSKAMKAALPVAAPLMIPNGVSNGHAHQHL